MEVLGERIVPSASTTNPVAANVAIGNAAPSQLTTAASLVADARQIQTQFVSTLIHDVQVFEGNLLRDIVSANPQMAGLLYNPGSNATAPESSGSGSGSGAMSTAHEGDSTPSMVQAASSQGTSMEPMVSGSGSGTGTGTGSGSGSSSGSSWATVSGEVWQDSNGDGLLDNGEMGMSGVTVNLVNAQGIALEFTTTDANGNYQLGLSVGSGTGSGSGYYQIQVVIPGGEKATIEGANGSGINSNIDASGYSAPLLMGPGNNWVVNGGLTTAETTVKGEVWLDSDGDGLLNNNETGFSAVQVNLETLQGSILQSTFTDGNGNYQFNVDLGSGSGYGSGYQIQVVLPSGYVGTMGNGSGSGIYSNINAQGYTGEFFLVAGGTSTFNAGLAPNPMVSGEVWLDSDGDGLLDNGESGASGIIVNLDDAQGYFMQSTTTDANGNYHFKVNLGSGYGSASGYKLQVLIPSGDVATIENTGGGGINSNIDGKGYSEVFTLPPGVNVHVNGGLLAKTGSGSGPATVKGEVWLDGDGDGLLDNSDGGAAGVTVNLDNADGMVIQSTTTDASGNYQFSVSLGSGSGSGSGYQIQVVLPDGKVATLENVSGSGLNSNIDSAGDSGVFFLYPGATRTINAGLAAEPVVSGEVWLDSDGDGLLDNGESGLSGVTVNLDNAQGVMLQSTSTDANGNYLFNVNLASGSGSGGGYEIQVVLPSGDKATLENAVGDGINSNIDAGGYSNLLALPPGASRQVNGGLVAQSGSGSGTATVSGEVWLDNNGDGSLDDGEMGFSNIEVDLESSTGEVLQSTTTDDAGDYNFTVNLGSGSGSGNSYKIQVILPVGDEATTEDTDSEIDANGFSFVFALNAGGAEEIKAGIDSTVVTTTQDDPTVPLQNMVTLRDAIQTVNDGVAKPVTFKAGLSGDIQLQKALPAFIEDIRIIGPAPGSGASITVLGSGANAPQLYRVFVVGQTVTAEIDNLGIENGFVKGNGGGILNHGILTLDNDVIDFNTADAGGAGGGIYNDPFATLQVIATEVAGNNAGLDGGGVFNAVGGSVQVFGGSEIFLNGAAVSGGGLSSAGGSVDISDHSLVHDNEADFGGGVAISGGTASISGGGLSGNKAAPQGNGKGGGIYITSGSLTLTGGVTIGPSNDAVDGGGLYLGKASTTTFNGCTISGNKAVDGVGYYEQIGATINPKSLDNPDGFDRGNS